MQGAITELKRTLLSLLLSCMAQVACMLPFPNCCSDHVVGTASNSPIAIGSAARASAARLAGGLAPHHQPAYEASWHEYMVQHTASLITK